MAKKGTNLWKLQGILEHGKAFKIDPYDVADQIVAAGLLVPDAVPTEQPSANVQRRFETVGEERRSDAVGGRRPSRRHVKGLLA